MSVPIQPASQPVGRPAPVLPDRDLTPPRSSWMLDAGMAVMLGCLLSATMYQQGTAAFLTSIVMTTSLVLRSNLPRVALIVCTVGALAQAVLVPTPTPAIMVVPVIVYSVARWSTASTARITLGIGFLGALIGPFRWLVLQYRPYGFEVASAAPALVISSFGCMGMVAAAYALGRRRRETVLAREQRMAAADERARHIQTERDQQVRMATVSERQRIAHELHDIVAHSLSVIVVQAEGGKAIAAKRPEVAPEVLETIADTGRDALVEMRRIVGLLQDGGQHSDGEEDTYVPTPGLADLPELIRKTGNARLVTVGTVPSVSQALGLTIYRVVQESLTNVLKHGGPGARATVVLSAHPDRLEVTVADDGRGAATESDGRGNGLRGMRERLAVHGGTLTAQPRIGGGFTVRAIVPGPQALPGRPVGPPPGGQGRPTGHGRVVA